MKLPWNRTPPPVEDRSDELAAAATANTEARAEAEAFRVENWRRYASVSVITSALLHEGAQNHFTQRIESALITSLAQRGIEL